MATSARATLTLALSVLLRLLAPILPFVTEEVWSWWHEGSIHRAPWPTTGELPATTGDSSVLQVASDVLGVVEKDEDHSKRGMKAEVQRLVVTGTADLLAAFEQALSTSTNAGNIKEIVSAEGEWAVSVELAPEENAGS